LEHWVYFSAAVACCSYAVIMKYYTQALRISSPAGLNLGLLFAVFVPMTL
jgi:hypothetical protein